MPHWWLFGPLTMFTFKWLLHVHRWKAWATIGLCYLISIFSLQLENPTLKLYGHWATSWTVPSPLYGTNALIYCTNTPNATNSQTNSTTNMPWFLSLPTMQQVFVAAMESFDKMKCKGMKFAEKHCCHLHMEEIHFLPSLNLWCKCHDLWHLVLHQKEGFSVKAYYINWLAKSCQVFNPLGASPLEATCAYQEASATYQRMKPQHKLLWADFLHSKLLDPTLLDTHHQPIAHLISLEWLWDTYQHIQALKTWSSGSSISQVDCTTSAGIQLTASKSDVENTLCHTLCSCFTWAHGSPFLHCPLVELIGSFGTRWAAQSVPEGTFISPPNVDDYTQCFIEAL